MSAVALSATLALGACGSATTTVSSTGAASSAVTSEAATAGDAAQASLSVGDTVALSELSEKSAAAVKSKGFAHMTQTVAGKTTSQAQLDYSGDVPRMAATMTQDGGTVEVIYTDKVMYMGGAQMATMTGGKKWVKIDPEADDAMSTMMAPTLRQLESSMSSPAEQLKAVEGVDATVSAVEDGRTTYTIKLTQENLTASLESTMKGLPGLTEAVIAQLPDGVTYTMTVDADHLPLEMTTDVQGQAMTITYSMWGEPVEIAAPPASEVGTFAGG